MITSFDVYLALILPDLALAIMSICFIGLIIFTATCFFIRCHNTSWDTTHGKNKEIDYPSIKFWPLVLVLTIIAATLVPDKKEMAAIYLVPKIANNQDLNQVPTNIARLINAKTGRYITNLLNGKGE